MNASTYLILRQDKRRNVPVTKVVGVRQTRPPLGDDEVAILVHLTLPEDLFKRAIPEANITVPDSCVNRPVVDVMAQPAEDFDA